MKRKFTAILLACCLCISMAPVAYAGTVQLYTDILLESPDSLDSSIFNNKYTYVTEEGTRALAHTTTFTKAEIDTYNECVSIATSVMTTVNVLGYIPAAAYQIGESIFDMNSAGTVKVYKQVNKRYKVNRLTGERTLDSTFWVIDFTLYKSSGTAYTSHSYTIRIK